MNIKRILLCSFLGMISVISFSIFSAKFTLDYSTYSEEMALGRVVQVMQHTSQWNCGEIGAAYFIGIRDKAHEPKLFYYPIRRLLVYGSEGDGWTEIHSVSVADINRVVKNGGGLKELEAAH